MANFPTFPHPYGLYPYGLHPYAMFPPYILQVSERMKMKEWVHIKINRSSKWTNPNR